jgi:heptosyltransferase-3
MSVPAAIRELRLGLRRRLRSLFVPLKRLWYARRRRKHAEAYARPVDRPRVLVAMTAGLGNAVEATPLVQAIRMLWPCARLEILPPPGDLFADWNIVDDLPQPTDLAGRAYDHTFVTYASELPPAASGVYGRVHNIRVLGGGWFLKPEAEYNLDMLRALGYGGPLPAPYVSLRRPQLEPPAGQPLICMAAGGKTEFRWRHKRWPFFGPLIRGLLARVPAARVCVVGGPSDEFPREAEGLSQVSDLRGQHTQRETAWLLKRAALVIGNDCGPMHIADAVMAPTLVIFGPTCEIKNGPRFRGRILAGHVECRPCQYGDLLLTCPEARCMLQLTPDAVLNEALDILRQTGRVPGNAGSGA